MNDATECPVPRVDSDAAEGDANVAGEGDAGEGVAGRGHVVVDQYVALTRSADAALGQTMHSWEGEMQDRLPMTDSHKRCSSLSSHTGEYYASSAALKAGKGDVVASDVTAAVDGTVAGKTHDTAAGFDADADADAVGNAVDATDATDGSEAGEEKHQPAGLNIDATNDARYDAAVPEAAAEALGVAGAGYIADDTARTVVAEVVGHGSSLA